MRKYKTKAKTQHKKQKMSKYKGQLNTMMKKLDKSYKKLDTDIKRHASLDIIKKDSNEILMLLGECNYMVREFHLFEREIKG